MGEGGDQGVRAVTGVTRLRAARVAGFDAVLEPPKAASKPSEFGCSNTKTPIILSKTFLFLIPILNLIVLIYRVFPIISPIAYLELLLNLSL